MRSDKIYEDTRLWKATLSTGMGETKFDAQRARLCAAYESFRINASLLVGQIQNDIPQLTLHNIEHLDALWTAADIVAGHDYVLTPTEAFVFGGAILLHDAGLAVASFQNGLEDLKKAAEWRDAAAGAYRNAGYTNIRPSDLNNPPAELFKDILFATLRSLHANRAEHLADFFVRNIATKEVVHLLDNARSKVSLAGYGIGKIAASHNWSIEELTSAPAPQNWGATRLSN